MSGYNLRILARNLVEEFASIGDSPVCLSTLPASNLLRPTERGRTARSTSLAAQRFDLYYTADRVINVMGATRTNWSTAATVALTHYGAGSPSTALLNVSGLAGMSTTGLDTTLDDYTSNDMRGYRNWIYYHAPFTTVRQSTVIVTDAANADGFIEHTKFWGGTYFQTTYDPPFGGVDFSPMDSSKQDRSDDGTMFVERGYRARKMVLRLDYIPDADLPTLLAISRYAGKTKEILIDLYPELGNAKNIYHRFAARITDSPTFNPHQVGLHKNTMTFEET